MCACTFKAGTSLPVFLKMKIMISSWHYDVIIGLGFLTFWTLHNFRAGLKMNEIFSRHHTSFLLNNLMSSRMQCGKILNEFTDLLLFELI